MWRAAARDGLAARRGARLRRRRVATLILTNDEVFAKVVAPRNLKLDGATGALKPLKKGLVQVSATSRTPRRRRAVRR